MNGTTVVRRSVGATATTGSGSGGAGAGGSVQELPPVATLVVYKDDAGYGMKVSGDNPVYVQSVKDGGAAARAGLHAGDTIIKVNGVNVTSSTHTEVVQLIKSSTQVVLTVQQKTGIQLGTQNQSQRPTSLTTAGSMVSSTSPQSSTSLHRAATAPAGTAPTTTARITGPQPVDLEKKRQLETQRVHTFQLMLEKEQSYVDKLRSELAKAGTSSGNASNITTLQSELHGAERRVRTLQEQLAAITTNDQLCSLVTNVPVSPGNYSSSVGGGVGVIGDIPPPLPSRKTTQSMMNNSPPPLPPRPPQSVSNTHNIAQLEPERNLMFHLTPPSHGIPNSTSPGSNLDSPSSSPSSSLNKHQRAKSSPEQLGNSPIVLSPSEASRRLILSESMNDLSTLSSSPPPPLPPPLQPSPLSSTLPPPPSSLLSSSSLSSSQNQGGRQSSIDVDDPIHITPPGTPPPPYPQQNSGLDTTTTSSSSSSSTIVNDNFIDNLVNYYLTPTRPTLNDSGTGLSLIQQPIMSMEDDDMSDQEVGQLEDHGPFKSLSRLWEHHAHLSVFINYVLSNSDPSSLLFYLITDLYKEGNAKEMRKWAYEIHSSFLVPCAPLRLNNVDESVACEIDDVLTKESDKEEILRKIFWKARARAKEELNEQLADFQQKRTAGLGMLFGPSDIQLDESETDKTKEYKIIETYLLPKMEPYIEDIEKDPIDTRQLTTAAGLATILTKIFQVRSVTLDHVPTFVAKDKSNIKTRLLANKNRKMIIKGHHFSIHQYYTVTSCNQCDNIIGGIGPQGYQCCDCSLSFHRQCVRTVDDVCPGPNLSAKKDRANDRLSKFMERIRPERKPPSSHHHHAIATNHIISAERMDSAVPDGENGEFRGGGASGNTRSERGRASVHDHIDSIDDPSSREDISEMVHQNISTKPKGANINRSESYKERIHHRKQMREKRKTSDPNLSKTNRTGYSDCEVPGGFPGNSAGSSSNSSLSTRSLDSPSTSLEQVHPTNSANNNNSTSGDSDIDVEADTPDWSHGVADDVLSGLTNSEKKRQEVINELFHTEKSHVRALKVLSLVFHKPLLNSNVLPLDQIELLFSNLDEMISIHSHFNQSMKRKKNENPCVGDIGELLLDMFDGDNGETFERAASKYCAKQQVALDALRDRRRKDTKLNAFLNEMESNPMCRRLQLKDHIPTGMLRLTKYPLLLENLAKYTPEKNEKERASVLRAWERSKEIVSLVNQAVRETEDCQRLEEIIRMIDDRSAFDKFDSSTVQEIKNLDITKRRLIFEGSLQLRMLNKPKPVDLHVVLMDDTILLLQKQEEKYLLKFMNANQSNSVLSPIVKISTVLVRNNAVDKNSLYLVNTSQKGAQIYDLVASTQAERKLWNKHISEAAEAYKAKNREGRRSSPPTVINDDTNSSSQDNQSDNINDKNKIDEEIEQKQTTEQLNSTISQTNNDDNNIDEPSTTTTTPTTTVESNTTPSVSSTIETVTNLSSTSNQQPSPTPDNINTQNSITSSTTPPATITTDGLQFVTCTQTSLIDPIEVHADERPVHTAEPVLTPIECLRRKDDVIKNALIEKQLLVADILNIPKEDFEHVADMASEATGLDKEPAELILAAISQTNQLMSIINSALNVTETEAVLAARGTNAASLTTSCDSPGCPVPRINQQQQQQQQQPSIPIVELQPICHSLTSQLSQLLEIIKQREEEREKLRKELRKSRERLHAFDIEAQKRDTSIKSSTIIPDNGENIHADCNEDLNKDEFVDACTDPEMIKSQPNNTKVTSSNQVMGDSVG